MTSPAHARAPSRGIRAVDPVVDPVIVARLQVASRVASVFVIAVGSLVLLGWLLDVATLKSVGPTLATMKANSALAFVLAGCSLWWLSDAHRKPRTRRVASGCAVVVILVGVLTLLQDASGWNLGIDQLLFQDAPNALQTGAPGRMAPATALNFILVGLALLLLETRLGKRRPADWLTLAAALVSLLALVGYLYGISRLYQVPSFTSMALHTALTFAALCVGILLARPERGVMASVTSDTLGGAAARRLQPAVIVLPILLGWIQLIGVRAGAYGVEFGLALFATSNVICFAVLTWWTTRTITRSETDRMEAKRALAMREAQLNSETRLRSLTDAAHDAIVSDDPAGAIIGWNHGAESTFGYTEAEMLGKPFTTVLPERYHEAHRIGIEHLGLTGQPRIVGKTVELKGLRKDGTEFPCELSLSTWTDENGSFYTRIIRDITERKEAERSVRASEARYRLIVETAREGICITDSETKFTFTNRRLEEMLGYGAGELLGNTFFALMDDEARDLAAKYFERRRQGISEGGEIKLKHKNGDDVWVRFASSPIVEGSGGYQGSLAMVTNITENRLAEQASERMQEQLILADRMASVGTLAAGIGHEINNPLAYIVANLDMVAEEIHIIASASPSGPIKEIEQMVNEAREGAERVRKIVRGLRTLSRADAERRVVLDVHAVLDLSIHMTLNEIRHRACVVKDYGTIARVEADETQLGQVFINLLVNAAHAIPEGSADTNEIRIVTSTDAADRVVVEVRDTGQGIPEEILSRIFDPFFTTKDVGGGTGLGLAICHGIVTGLGGEISVESQLGKGTLFRVALPSAPRGTMTEVKRPTPMKPGTVRRGQLLIVDDDPLVARSLLRILAEHEVTLAANGRQALDLLESGKHFDVILCDLMMPVMTGVDLYRQVLAQLPELVERIVFITGGAFTSTTRAFLDAIPNVRMEKPFDAHRVRALVQRFLGGVEIKPLGTRADNRSTT